jgi:uncharacterized protein (DUF1778 family)
MATAAISLRIKERQLDLINQAAEISGKSRSSFMLDASCENAINILLDQRLFRVDEEKFQQFQDVLDAPVEDNPALRAVLSHKAPWE